MDDVSQCQSVSLFRKNTLGATRMKVVINRNLHKDTEHRLGSTACIRPRSSSGVTPFPREVFGSLCVVLPWGCALEMPKARSMRPERYDS